MNDAIELMVASRVLHDADEFGAQIDDLADDYTRRYEFHHSAHAALHTRLRRLRKAAKGKGEFQAAKDCDDQLAHMLAPGTEVVVLPAQSNCEELRWLVAEYALESVYNMLCDEDDIRISKHGGSQYSMSSPFLMRSFKQAVFDEALHHASVCGMQVAEFTTWLYQRVGEEILAPSPASLQTYRVACADAPTERWCTRTTLALLCEVLLDIAREQSRP